MMIRVIAADEQPLFLEGIRCVAANTDDVRVIASAVDEATLNDELKQRECDVLVLGMSIADRGALELIGDFETRYPALRILVMDIGLSDSVVVRILRSHASGYLSKTANPEEFIQAVRQVKETGRYLSHSIAEKIAFRLGREHDREPHETLSDREYEVLRLIGAGMTIRKIARDLGISQNTVNTHRYRILQKMGMKSSAELIHYAVKHQLVE